MSRTSRRASKKARSMKSKKQKPKKPQRLPSNRPKPKAKAKNKGRAPRRKAFEEVRLGHLMKYRAPLEYALVMESCTKWKGPDADLIESISYASTNPFFRSVLFRRALIDYRIHGLHGAVGKHRSEASNIRTEQLTYKRMLKANV